MATATLAQPAKLRIPYEINSVKHQEFHAAVSAKRISALIGGVGSGKTYAGAQEALRQCLKRLAGQRGLIAAPTYPMLRRSTMRVFYDLLPPELIAERNKTEKYLRLHGGSEIDFVSCEDPDANRGPSVAWIWVDEGALVTREAYEVLLARLREGGDKRRLWITTTPKGMTWLYDEFMTGKPDRQAVVGVASTDNPHLPGDFVGDLLQTYSGKFAEQEIQGLFVKFEGLVYAMLEAATHQMTKEPSAFVSYEAGVDWGYTNPGVIVVGGITADDEIHLVEETHERGMLLDAWIETAKGYQKKYNIKTFWCDPSEPGYIEAFRAAGIPAEPADNDVLAGIATVNSMLSVDARGKVRLTFSPAVPRTYSDHQQYQWKANPEGKPLTKEEPLKVKDHGCDAVRYLAHSRRVQTGRQPRLAVLDWGEGDEN